MLSAGLARVYSFSDNRTAVAAMFALERAARALGRGIWRDPVYAVRSEATAGEWCGRFEMVFGRASGRARGGQYASIPVGAGTCKKKNNMCQSMQQPVVDTTQKANLTSRRET